MPERSALWPTLVSLGFGIPIVLYITSYLNVKQWATKGWNMLVSLPWAILSSAALLAVMHADISAISPIVYEGGEFSYHWLGLQNWLIILSNKAMTSITKVDFEMRVQMRREMRLNAGNLSIDLMSSESVEKINAHLDYLEPKLQKLYEEEVPEKRAKMRRTLKLLQILRKAANLKLETPVSQNNLEHQIRYNYKYFYKLFDLLFPIAGKALYLGSIFPLKKYNAYYARKINHPAALQLEKEWVDLKWLYMPEKARDYIRNDWNQTRADVRALKNKCSSFLSRIK
jgi:hypothetical protein